MQTDSDQVERVREVFRQYGLESLEKHLLALGNRIYPPPVTGQRDDPGARQSHPLTTQELDELMRALKDRESDSGRVISVDQFDAESVITTAPENGLSRVNPILPVAAGLAGFLYGVIQGEFVEWNTMHHAEQHCSFALSFDGTSVSDGLGQMIVRELGANGLISAAWGNRGGEGTGLTSAADRAGSSDFLVGEFRKNIGMDSTLRLSPGSEAARFVDALVRAFGFQEPVEQLVATSAATAERADVPHRDGWRSLKHILMPPPTYLFRGETCQFQDFRLAERANGSLEVTGYVGDMAAVTVPGFLNGRPVTSIGHSAFAGNSVVARLELPEGLTCIRDSAFSGCLSLTKITVPDSVIEIGEGAFAGCWSLQSIALPQRLKTIGASAFSSCVSLRSIVIPPGVTRIHESTFYSCLSMTAVSLADDLTSIGVRAFDHCFQLAEFSLPATLQSLGPYAFGSCTALTDLELPRDLTAIGNFAFSGCSAIASIVFPSSLTSTGKQTFEGCSALTRLNLPDSLPEIDVGVFASCRSLREIEFPASLRSVGNAAFQNCSSLVSLSMPESVSSIGSRAFQNCTLLSSVRLPEHLESLGRDAFQDCSALTDIRLPQSLVSVSGGSFMGCTSLARITIPERIESIGRSAFEFCSSLIEVSMPDGLNSVDRLAFAGCVALARAILPATVTTIGASAFSGCSSLVDITMPKELTTVSSAAFSGCSALASIALGDRVGSIGHHAFAGCSSLRTVTLGGSNPPTLGTGVFVETGNLTIRVPEAVLTNYQADDGWIEHSDSIEGYDLPFEQVAGETHRMHARDPVLGEPQPEGSSELVHDTSGRAHFSMSPDGSLSFQRFERVEFVHDGMSFQTSADGSLTLSSYGRKLRGLARQVSEVSVPEAVNGLPVSSIGIMAFSGCAALARVTLPATLTAIDPSAFAGCASLASITVPRGVVSIGDGAFLNCKALTTISLPDRLERIPATSFSGCSSLMVIAVPEGVTSIGHDAFAGSVALSDVTLPASLTEIDHGAFSGCSSLESIVLPESIRSIGFSAFAGCLSLVSVTFIGMDPPELSKAATFTRSENLSIYVPRSAMDSYMNTPGWHAYAEHLRPINE